MSCIRVNYIMFPRENLQFIVNDLLGWTTMSIVLLGDVLGMFPPSSAECI